MDAEIDAVFGAKSRAALQELLQSARIAWANLSTLADLPTRSDAPRQLQVPLLDEQGAAIRAEFAG